MARYLEASDFSSTEFPEAAAIESPSAAESSPSEAESTPSWVDAEVEVSVATYQAYQILYYAFTGLMGLAGIDKFMHIFPTWEAYVSPSVASFLHMSPG